MLNDLIAIERGLRSHNIDVAGRHPDIKDMAKGRALRVRLTVEGAIDSAELVAEAGGGRVWTLRDGQHNGFPGLKTPGESPSPKSDKKKSGLLALSSDALQAHQAAWEAAKSPKDRREEVRRLLADYSIDPAHQTNWPTAKHRQRIAERLDALRGLADDARTAAVPAAFERFLAALNAAEPFLVRLKERFSDHVENDGDDWIDFIRTILIEPVALVIDVEALEFTRDATDPRQVSAVSSLLSSASAARSNRAILCALGGEAVTPHTGTFPQPNLPVIGQTYIFSRNKDIPALERYGKTADASFPIGLDLVQRLAAAAVELTREEKKGKSWALIPAESGKNSDLLIVSHTDPGLRPAEALAGDDKASGVSALQEIARRVIAQSQGKLPEESRPQENITLLVLRSVNPANRKSVYHHRLTASAFWHAAQHWQTAIKNNPDWIRFPVPGKERTEPALWRPPAVVPLSLIPQTSCLFAQGGQRAVKLVGANVAEALDLFLGRGDVPRLARRLLAFFVRREKDLLSGLAQAQRKGSRYLEIFDREANLRRHALRSATWLGVLLHHIGRSREVYMSDTGFQLGQLLAAADLVHIGYCMDVRKGGMPAALIGNSVLTTASERPHAALQLLLKRWPPYALWASSTVPVSSEKEADRHKAIAINRALSQARRIKPLAESLHMNLRALDGRTDEAFQAELLLGYMAGLPPKRKSEGETLAGDDTSEGEEA